MFFNKGAMFGLDARIALSIFGALSVISAAALYNSIQSAQFTAIHTELKEVAKASESYLIDYGSILSSAGSSTAKEQSTRAASDLVTVGNPINNMPYLSYEVDGYSLKHRSLGYINIYSLSADESWDSADLTDSYCYSSKSCNLWIGLDGFSDTSILNKFDEKFDDGISNTGSIRFDSTNLEVYVKDISVPEMNRDFFPTGSWERYITNCKYKGRYTSGYRYQIKYSYRCISGWCDDSTAPAGGVTYRSFSSPRKCRVGNTI
tara:strand:+ start:71 stop:856 length:786 start_codon:yes stop_codon:yes gene_type:complete